MELASSSSDSSAAHWTETTLEGHTDSNAADAARGEAFGRLYRDHRHALYLYCLRRTHDPDLAEDIVQEVFAKAFSQMSTFDHNRPFWSWIVSMAARRCIDAHRRSVYAQARISELRGATVEGRHDPTADVAVSRIDYQAFERAVTALPARQRVALQLFALDGWTYPEIAAQLGCTVATIKQLIVRARAALRQTGARPLAGLGGAIRVLTTRARLLLERVPGFLGGAPEAAPTWTHAIAGALTAAVVASGVGLVVVPSGQTHGDGQDASEVTPPVDVPAPLGAPAVSSGRVARTWVRPAEPPLRPYQRALERSVNDAADVAPGPSTADEDHGRHTEFTVSPGYDEDRTVYASGIRSSGSGWLLVTRDGGTTWHRPAAKGLGGVYRLLLPPAHPRDPRMFATTSKGLQVSEDGGESFDTLVAGTAPFFDAALSPAFDDGHQAILMTGLGRLFEYRHDTGTLRLLILEATGVRDNWVVGARYGASYPADPTVLVSTRTMGPRHSPPLLHRCRVIDTSLVEGVFEVARGGDRLRCHEQITLPENDIYDIGLQETRRSVPEHRWAVAGHDVYMSSDDERSFTRARRPTSTWGYSGLVTDIAPVPGTGGASVVVAQVPTDALSVLERTDDAGATWRPLTIGLPGFDEFVEAVAVTPTGRILVSAEDGRLACSADGGHTWAPTCAVPDGA